MTVDASPSVTPVFDNRFVAQLPADPDPENRARQVSGALYTRVRPVTVPRPQTVAWSPEVAQGLLELPEAFCESPEFAEVFAGNRLLPGMDSYASCYGGHQFGHWAGQLGDGRAINLGELVNGRGEHWTLQLKGAGPTPYSRTADGLAVLRSSVREFLCSEAMHHLGVPTTRALSLVLTGREVVRDMFYDGNPRAEPGAVVCRVAESFTRFGHFQLPAARRDIDLLRRLADFTIRHDFPEYAAGPPERPVHDYPGWFAEVCRRTAAMVVHWMRVGFVHGVMNTDNMSVLGQTIDYGPYGWLEDYDPDWTPNTTDAGGRRYRFGHQPQVALWNLTQLGNALVPLVESVDVLQQALESYIEAYQGGWRSMMAAKLGLDGDGAEDDLELFETLTELLAAAETDMTLFFRHLADYDPATPGRDELASVIAPAWYRPEQAGDEAYRRRLDDWEAVYRRRLARGGPDSHHTRHARMNAVNPLFVPRNYLAQMAIDQAEQGDFALVNELLETFRRPYQAQPGREGFAALRPDWARTRPGCSMLSCSS